MAEQDFKLLVGLDVDGSVPAVDKDIGVLATKVKKLSLKAEVSEISTNKTDLQKVLNKRVSTWKTPLQLKADIAINDSQDISADISSQLGKLKTTPLAKIGVDLDPAVAEQSIEKSLKNITNIPTIKIKAELDPASLQGIQQSLAKKMAVSFDLKSEPKVPSRTGSTAPAIASGTPYSFDAKIRASTEDLSSIESKFTALSNISSTTRQHIQQEIQAIETLINSAQTEDDLEVIVQKLNDLQSKYSQLYHVTNDGMGTGDLLDQYTKLEQILIRANKDQTYLGTRITEIRADLQRIANGYGNFDLVDQNDVAIVRSAANALSDFTIEVEKSVQHNKTFNVTSVTNQLDGLLVRLEKLGLATKGNTVYDSIVALKSQLSDSANTNYLGNLDGLNAFSEQEVNRIKEFTKSVLAAVDAVKALEIENSKKSLHGQGFNLQASTKSFTKEIDSMESRLEKLKNLPQGLQNSFAKAFQTLRTEIGSSTTASDFDKISTKVENLKVALNGIEDSGNKKDVLSKSLLKDVDSIEKQFEQLTNLPKGLQESFSSALSSIRQDVATAFDSSEFDSLSTKVENLKATLSGLESRTAGTVGDFSKYESRYDALWEAAQHAGAGYEFLTESVGESRQAIQNIVALAGKDTNLIPQSTIDNAREAVELLSVLEPLFKKVSDRKVKIDFTAAENTLNSYIATLQKLDIGPNVSVVKNITNAFEQLGSLRDSMQGDILPPDQVEAAQKFLQLMSQIGSEMKKIKSASGLDFFGESILRRFEEAQSKVKDFIRQHNRIQSNPELKQMADDITSVSAASINTKPKLEQFLRRINEFKEKCEDAGATSITFADRIKQIGQNITAANLILGAWNFVKETFSKAVENVKNLDAAMTELKKVTEETDKSYQAFLKSASVQAHETGATLTDTVTSTADFARLGHTMEDAQELSRIATIYKNVGDGFESVTESSEAIISIMGAFNIEAQRAVEIVDALNEVGNRHAISSGGLGRSLQNSASALHEAGASMQEAMALTSAANITVQDPEQVGNALKTIALRIRGTKAELEAMGEDATGAAESTSKLRAEIQALTNIDGSGGVDIMLDENRYKNIYDILKEIAVVWKDLEDVDAAALLELLAGKNRSNILAGLLNNFDDAEKALEHATESEGSALAENEKYLDSINGKLNQFTAAFERLSSALLDSDIFKALIDGGTTLLNILSALIEEVGGFGTAISALVGLGAFAFKDSQDFFTGEYPHSLPESFRNVIEELSFTGEGKTARVKAEKQAILQNDEGKLSNMLTAYNNWLSTGEGTEEHLKGTQALAAAYDELSDSAKTYYDQATKERSQILDVTQAVKVYVDAQQKNIDQTKVMTLGQKAAKTVSSALTGALANVAAAFAMWVAQETITFLHDVVFTSDAAREKIDELSEEINELSSNEDKIEQLGNRFVELKAKAYIGDLGTEELQEYYDVQNQLHELLPELQGYYDLQGNYILTEIGNVADLTDKYDALIASKEKAIATEYTDKWMGIGRSVQESDIDDYEQLQYNSQNTREWIALDAETEEEFKEKYERGDYYDPEKPDQWTYDDLHAKWLAGYNEWGSADNARLAIDANDADARAMYNELLKTVGYALNGNSSYNEHDQNTKNAIYEALKEKSYLELQEFLSNLTAGGSTALGAIEGITKGSAYDDIVSGRLDQFDTAGRDAIIRLGGLEGAEQALSTFKDNQDDIINGTEKWADTWDAAKIAAVQAYDAAKQKQAELHDSSASLMFPDDATSQSAIVAEMKLAEEAAGTLATAYKELRDDGAITAETIASLGESFGSCEEEWSNFLDLVGSGDMTLSSLSGSLNELLSAYVKEKALLGQVNENTQGLLQSMLESIGVTNAEEIAAHALNEALAEVAVQKIAAAIPDLANMTNDEWVELYKEASSSQEVAAALYKLYYAKLAAADGGLASATETEIQRLRLLAQAAGVTGEALLIYDQYNALRAQTGASLGIDVDAIEAQRAAVEKKMEEIPNSFPSQQWEANWNDVANKASGATSKIKTAFKKMYDELKYQRGMNLISEEKYLAQLLALNEKYNKQNVETYRKYQLEIFNGLKSLAAKKINDQADAQIKALKKQRKETEKYYDDLIEKEQEKLDALRKEWEEQDKLLKIEQARAALAKAQSQNTAHIYRDGEGFVWEPDQDAIQDANDNLTQAIQDHQRWLEELAIEERIDQLEEAKEKALEIIDEEIEKVEEWRDTALEALEEVQFTMEDFLEFFEEFGIKIDEELLKMMEDIKETEATTVDAISNIQGSIDSLTGKTVEIVTVHRTVYATENVGSVENSTSTRGANTGGLIGTKNTEASTRGANTGGLTKDTPPRTNSVIGYSTEGWLRANGYYASGTLSVPHTGMYLTDEEGPEIKIPGKGTFQKLTYGTSVLPANVSKNLWAIGAKPLSFAKGIANMISNKTSENHIVQQNFGEIVLPNVTNAEQFTKELRHFAADARQWAYSK